MEEEEEVEREVEEEREKEVVVSVPLCGRLSGTFKAFKNSQHPLMKPKQGQSHAVLVKIIRGWSLSTHTYCNNQEHSVLSKQGAGIPFWLLLNVQHFTSLVLS